MLKEVQWHQTTAQFREHLLDNHPIYQTNIECARQMAAVEQWIGAAATRRRMCPFNQHSRNGRTPQIIFVFGRDKDQDRWSVRRFDSELQNEERVADMELRRKATYSVAGGGDGGSGNTIEALTAPEGSVGFSNDLTSWIWSTMNPVETLAEIRGATTASTPTAITGENIPDAPSATALATIVSVVSNVD
nr:unnamed protein product [Spirometra erinaceieuropaei]